MTHEFDNGNTSLSGDFNMLTTKVREIENKYYTGLLHTT